MELPPAHCIEERVHKFRRTIFEEDFQLLVTAGDGVFLILIIIQKRQNVVCEHGRLAIENGLQCPFKPILEAALISDLKHR